MEIVLIILLCILITLVTVFGVLSLQRSKNSEISDMEKRINDNMQNSIRLFNNTVSQNQKSIGQMQATKFRELDIVLKDMYDIMDKRLDSLNRNMGEMHSLAMGVNDLQRVLSNVKTRGILGEIQLEAILEEILAPEQYEKNIATVPNSRNLVEFAIKLPGTGEGYVYLPIDSKFPLDAYNALCQAKEEGIEIKEASRELAARIRGFAKDIHVKYISPPNTTEFAIMFLPVEGLYLEVVNMGLVEVLQREYKVNIAGPSTFAAMLNALQMGFRTLAVEQKSIYVWEILAEVKMEFVKFNEILVMSQQKIHQAENDLDKLIGVRTRAIMRKLEKLE